MPTTTISLNCESKLTEKQKSDIRSMIASYDYSLVAFKYEHDEESHIDWDDYMGQFCCFGG